VAGDDLVGQFGEGGADGGGGDGGGGHGRGGWEGSYQAATSRT
jgi:hypothetical protein